ncbi:hypothetical protein Pint_36024 [Pistacia integerrima]|uniref:Uncharacterized protein n=1 Tax=Pistacia integerrima TaxID=434235 RepID=A0ACC0Y2P5_9ROSI|nr:hypothetical protein Pint_36024 [Pistacia integerrima]
MSPGSSGVFNVRTRVVAQATC